MAQEEWPEYKYQYRYLQEVSNPLSLAKQDDKKKIAGGPKHFPSRPTGNKSWAQVLKERDKDTKLFFVTRHGQSEHNVLAHEYGRALYYEFLAQNPKDSDPNLTAKGVGQAKDVATAMQKVDLPQTIAYYSSPQRRCVMTAIHASNTPYGKGKAIHISDDLREWFGWDHNHSSDQRLTKTEILKYAKKEGRDVVPDASFPEEDKMAKENTHETYSNVRFRLQRALNNIYKDEAKTRVIHLFLHNRCFRAFLAVIGHTINEEEFDLANCATVAFLVQRKPVSDEVAKAKSSEELKRRGTEKTQLDKERTELRAAAHCQVFNMEKKLAAKLLSIIEKDEKNAAKASIVKQWQKEKPIVEEEEMEEKFIAKHGQPKWKTKNN